jgi:glycosyltransferase involved in cell wall biosynthesis
MLTRSGDAAVAIITRTQDRPLTLARTIQDILAQRFTDWHWVLVSDAGNLPAIESVLASHARQLAGRHTLVRRTRSEGGGAASNSGIAASRSRFIVLHDDDDSWHPDFLAEAVAFLSRSGQPARAVATGWEILLERMEGEDLVETGRRPGPAAPVPITAASLRRRNRFPPIAFLYERQASESIGHYRTSIPLLTDWDFHVRFAERFEIGYLPRILAYWHRRTLATGVPRVYANYSYRRNLDVLMRLKQEWGLPRPYWRYLLWWRY